MTFSLHFLQCSGEQNANVGVDMQALHRIGRILNLWFCERKKGKVQMGRESQSCRADCIVWTGDGGREGGISSLSAVAVTEDSSPTLSLC